MTLIQSLFGGDQQPAQQGGSDLLEALFGGGQPAQQSGNKDQDGLDLGDLLNAGMSFMNAKQQGRDNLQAGLSALLAAGPMAQKPHPQQSGQLLANTLLQAIVGRKNR